MRKLWFSSLILLAVVLLNGCSKCSREEIPPTTAPVPTQDSLQPGAPTDEMDIPAETDEAPSDADPGDADESVD